MEDYCSHAQQSATALCIHMNTVAGTSNAARSNIPLGQYGGTGCDYLHNTAWQPVSGSTDELLAPDENDGSSSSSSIIADDHSPISAYFEIATIRWLLLEHVGVVLGPGQLNSPDVQLNLITPLWQAVQSKCGICIQGAIHNSNCKDVQGHSGSSEPDGRPLPSAAILYAALANQDYFLILAGAGQLQADLHESRAEVSEVLGTLCAKALHKLGGQTLSNALCAKFTPLDVDGLLAHNADVVVCSDRHMSLLSLDEWVHVYRLGRAGNVSSGTKSPCSKDNNNHAAKEYLSGGTHVLVEQILKGDHLKL